MAETNELVLEFDLDRELVEPVRQAIESGGPIADMAIDTMLAGLMVMEEQISIRTPVNLGLLRGSISRGEPVRRGDGLEGDVNTPSPYGLPVERGRKAGKAPMDVVGYTIESRKPIFAAKPELLLWTKRKLGLQGQEAEEVARIIAIRIGKHGTEGAHMFRDGQKAAEPYIDDLWTKFLEDVIDYLATNGGRQ